ncbi:unnamed protein product [Zymoseptoria tritici ST99CH_3D7]|uniref:Uncharacterized protein n=1 Tax=Zymoseptoria tritici (strain ST99CH_3D7) TaxID=1276538 RepID=A0A1X7RBS5_ZYMT9|nr:unnamed protein product [Zymoseptoria tritici ST99CH_3D7]
MTTRQTRCLKLELLFLTGRTSSIDQATQHHGRPLRRHLHSIITNHSNNNSNTAAAAMSAAAPNTSRRVKKNGSEPTPAIPSPPPSPPSPPIRR